MDEVLIHYGIPGMKWGIRRTDSELNRARKMKEASTMSDEELKARVNRLNLEKQYVKLTGGNDRDITERGRNFVVSIMQDSAEYAVRRATKNVVKKVVDKYTR